MIRSFDTHLLTLIENKGNVDEVKTIIEREKLHLVVEKLTRNNLLHYAAKWNNVDVATFLVEKIKNKRISRLNAGNIGGVTPLELAALHRCKDVAEILIRAGADILLKQEDSISNSIAKIFMINKWFDRRMLGILVGKDGLPNDEEIADGLLEYGWYLHDVILLRNANLTKLVLDRQYLSDINDKNIDGETPLYIATRFADIENVKLLLNYKANVHEKDRANRKALWYVDESDDETIEIFAEPKARLNILKMLLESFGSLVDSNGEIHMEIGYLLENGKKEVIQLLFQSFELENYLDTIVYSYDNCSVFERLVENKNPGIIEQLDGKNFNINNSNYLMRAVEEKNFTAVEFLLDRGADVNAEDEELRTPLIEAIEMYKDKDSGKQIRRDFVQLLLEHGANAQRENDNEEIVLEILLEYENFPISELVLDHLALQKAKGTPIIEAVENIIRSCKEFRTYFQLSEKQLNVEACKSITLLSLLTDSDMKMERYVYNEELFSKLSNFKIDDSSKFYYFKTVLKKRLKQAVDNAELRRKAAHIISRIMDQDYARFPLITDQIACYLAKTDMENLLAAFSN